MTHHDCTLIWGQPPPAKTLEDLEREFRGFTMDAVLSVAEGSPDTAWGKSARAYLNARLKAGDPETLKLASRCKRLGLPEWD